MGLKESIASLESRFGKGTVIKMSDGNIDAPRISSGSLKLDVSIGGIARGKIIEIFADEACGKTGLALEILREFQHNGEVGAIVDAEHALNPQYAKKIGVNMDDIYLAQPSSGEEAFEIARELVRSNEVRVIIIDSVSALTPKSELDGETGEAKMGAQARMMSQGLRQITAMAATNDCTLIFLNQMREKIGVMFGDPRVTSGGNALKFYAAQRFHITRSLVTEAKVSIGFTQKIKCVKNKIGVPFRMVERFIHFEDGIDEVSELLDVAVDLEICERKGAWFYYGEVKLGQGKDKAIATLKDNPELQEEILNNIKK